MQVTFAFAAGPLAWSVVAFRNSLVFHSLDKVCGSVLVTPSPMLNNSKHPTTVTCRIQAFTMLLLIYIVRHANQPHCLGHQLAFV